MVLLNLSLVIDCTSTEAVLFFGCFLLTVIVLVAYLCQKQPEGMITSESAKGLQPQLQDGAEDNSIAHTKVDLSAPQLMHQSEELKILQAFSYKLTLLISNCTGVGALADFFHQEGIIAFDLKSKVTSAYNFESSRALMQALQAKVKANPKTFVTFLTILKYDPVFNDVRKEMEMRYYSRQRDTATVAVNIVSYGGKLTGRKFDKRCSIYRRALLNNDCQKFESLINGIPGHFSLDEILFFQCYYCLALTHMNDETSITTSVSRLNDIVRHSDVISGSNNGDIIKGRAFRIMASAYRKLCNFEEAFSCIQQAIIPHQYLEDCCEKACTFLELAKIQQSNPSECTTRHELLQTFRHVKHFSSKCKDKSRQRKMLMMLEVEMATFLLNPTKKDKSVAMCDWMDFSPSCEELHEAFNCLERSKNSPDFTSTRNIYQVRLKTAMSDLSRLRRNYTEAFKLIESAHSLVVRENILGEDCLRITEKREWLHKRVSGL